MCLKKKKEKKSSQQEKNYSGVNKLLLFKSGCTNSSKLKDGGTFFHIEHPEES